MSGFDGAYCAGRWRAITPSDTASVEPRCDGLFVGTAGDVVAVDRDGNVATFKAAAGAILPISPTFVRATGTTASNIVGLRP